METIKMNLITLAAGAVAGWAFAWAKTKLPDLLAGYVDRAIDDMLAAGDAIDDELVLALCRWAEKKAEQKFPAGATGAQKYQLVADKLISLLPITVRPFASARSSKLAEVIEASVVRLKTELASKASAPQP